MKYICLLIISLMMLTSFSYAQTSSIDEHPFTSAADSDRFLALTGEIRCVVCQGQNIADSNAPLAKDLREKVYRMVLDKKTDAEIKDYMVKRYGEFILLQPRFNSLTSILWLFPLIGLAGALFFLARFVKRNNQTA